jgi:hypothetical protein
VRYHSGNPKHSDGYGGIGVEPHKDQGGKRKGKTMKRRTLRTNRLPHVTKEQLLHARDNGGTVTVSETGRPLMVTYYRKGG